MCFQNNLLPPVPPLVIDDMAHMAQFVFDYYSAKVRQLASRQGVSTGVLRYSGTGVVGY